MTLLQLELPRDDSEESALQLKALGPSMVAYGAPDHFEGDVNVITAVVTVSTATIGAIASIIKARIAAKKEIKVKIKDVEISGADLKDVEKFLNSLVKP